MSSIIGVYISKTGCPITFMAKVGDIRYIPFAPVQECALLFSAGTHCNMDVLEGILIVLHCQVHEASQAFYIIWCTGCCLYCWQVTGRGCCIERSLLEGNWTGRCAAAWQGSFQRAFPTSTTGLWIAIVTWRNICSTGRLPWIWNSLCQITPWVLPTEGTQLI